MAETAVRRSVLIIKCYHNKFCDFCFDALLFSRVVKFVNNKSDYVQWIRKFLFLSFATRVSLLDPVHHKECSDVMVCPIEQALHMVPQF